MFSEEGASNVAISAASVRWKDREAGEKILGVAGEAGYLVPSIYGSPASFCHTETSHVRRSRLEIVNALHPTMLAISEAAAR